MATEKIINSIKIDSTFANKVFKVNSNLDLVPADIDILYKEITGHPTGIVQTSFNTWTYNVADFIGPGIDTSKIRGIYVSAYVDSYNGTGIGVSATMPWDPTGEYYQMFYLYQHGNNGDGRGQGTSFFEIPISAGQTSFNLYIYRNASCPAPSVSLIGVKQISL